MVRRSISYEQRGSAWSMGARGMSTAISAVVLGGISLAWVLALTLVWGVARLEEFQEAEWSDDQAGFVAGLRDWEPLGPGAERRDFSRPADQAGCLDPRTTAWTGTTHVVAVTLTSCETQGGAAYIKLLSDRTVSLIESQEALPALEHADVSVFAAESWVGRAWVQDRTLISVQTACPPADDDCDQQNAVHTDDLARRLPGEPYLVASAAMSTLSGAALVWLTLLVLPARAVTWLVGPRDPRVAKGIPGVVDVSTQVRREHAGWRWRRFLPVAALSLVIGAGTLASLEASSLWQRLVLGVVATAIGALGVYRFLSSRAVRRDWGRAEASLYGTRLRSSIGLGLRDGGAIASSLTFVLLASLLLLQAVSGQVGPDAIVQRLTEVSNEPLTANRFMLTLMMLAMAAGHIIGPADIPLLVLPGLALSGAAVWIGRRLGATSLAEALSRDSRPHLILLRSFDEDRSRVKTRLPASGALPRWLRLRSTRRFEETLAVALNRWGPVVAIAPPGTRLPNLGAAKATLPNEVWRDHVRELTDSARAVVMMATPDAVNPGYEWEIKHVAAQACEKPVLLVLAPRRWSDLQRRWSAFMATATQVPRFQTLPASAPPPGTHVIAIPTDRPPAVFCAQRRTDLSHAVALREAFGYVVGPEAQD